ncbi:SUMF1/EgtB/PvdO family nonheme iron enzyme [Granulicella sp. L60]|uniref:formylglycine-generating enzyme family protein n=1 Tax=Granulicella sp. L60 TaxID=1641866 RepID=UPI0020B128C3|nr:SUMF1/EgtB/PvdO family nonheme iron enzyme [Granulicella sp. L60]
MRTPASTCTDDELGSWLADIDHWRAERRIRVGYDGKQYERSELLWTQSSYIQTQMMVHDRFFYNPTIQKYTVDRYLKDLETRYGGVDSVLIWPTYPNLGIDDRNQYDLVRDLPGGLEGVKRMVDDFHSHHVRVLFPAMLWDQGTHPEGTADSEALARELATIDADGINGDTLEGVPRTFRTASDGFHHPLALEPELGPASDEMLNYNNMTWGYWKYDFVPSISLYKWLEPRHMVNISNRWAHDHQDDLQFAFFNGVGFESWENVWGIWNQITPRDAEALRRISTIERAYRHLLVSKQWEPHTAMLQFGVFASKWPSSDATLWTIVNRNHYEVTGRQLAIPYREGVHYYDLWNGAELQPRHEGNQSILSFPLESDGYGAVLASIREDDNTLRVLSTMHALSEQRLARFSKEWVSLPQEIVSAKSTVPPTENPPGMVKIPATKFVFSVNGIEIEGTNDNGVDVQYPGERSARRYHDFEISIGSFWIDTYPVTNAEFKKFLDVTRYSPTDQHNFLKDWVKGTYPLGWADKPVTWISLEDARAYAKWAGKRLPHEWEWQYAAQGSDGRVYPWGNAWNPNDVPAVDTGRMMQPPSDVTDHPRGASPFGVQDLVGNVWQWTDEFTDEHTRAAIIRGGSHYQPQGSRWYFPQAYKLSQHGKYLLMAPGIDRSGTIGFRCVMDAEDKGAS